MGCSQISRIKCLIKELYIQIHDTVGQNHVVLSGLIAFPLFIIVKYGALSILLWLMQLDFGGIDHRWQKR